MYEHSDIVPKTFFEKLDFEKKKSADDNKSIRNYPACNVFYVSVMYEHSDIVPKRFFEKLGF